MDLFTRDRSAAYVPAFASRLMLAMGKGIGSASGEIRRIGEEDAANVWTLSLILVRWYADALPSVEANIVTALLDDAELLPILGNLSVFRANLLPFVKAAHEAQSEPRLAAAGVYFTSAVQQIGLSLIAAAIKSGPVAVLKEKLGARFPLPAGLEAAYAATLQGVAALGAAPPLSSPVTAAPKASRGDRFERAGFERRQRTPSGADTVAERGFQAPAAWGAPSAKGMSAPSAATPVPATSTPPSPQLESFDVTRAFLLTLKWKPDEVERLLAGPKRRA